MWMVKIYPLNNRWVISDDDPGSLIDSLMKAIASLPQLTNLNVETLTARIPLGLVANLSKLTIQYGDNENTPFFTSQVATVIANSPHLKKLDVTNWVLLPPLPTLRELFAKLTPQNHLPPNLVYGRYRGSSDASAFDAFNFVSLPGL
jgi:hypothetical protein